MTMMLNLAGPAQVHLTVTADAFPADAGSVKYKGEELRTAGRRGKRDPAPAVTRARVQPLGSDGER